VGRLWARYLHLRGEADGQRQVGTADEAFPSVCDFLLLFSSREENGEEEEESSRGNGRGGAGAGVAGFSGSYSRKRQKTMDVFFHFFYRREKTS
jgi:hypothetical protein